MSKDKTGSVMVVGGGIAGMQTALDLADSGFFVYLVERSSSIGGVMSQLDKTFPTEDCSLCILSPKLVEVGRHINIELLTLSEVVSVSGEEGNFAVKILQHPRYIDMNKCIACGACAEKCPKKVDDAYNCDLIKRKAIYSKYSQAVPLKYAIDPEHCIYLTKGKCRACEKICPAGAVNFEDCEKELSLEVGSIVLSPGFEPYNPMNFDGYGYGRYPNVVTSLEFERILSASGPFGGHVTRLSDHKDAKKIAWIQCVGSRDTHEGALPYCSSVCCTYAIKEAVVAKEHVKDLDAAVFYIDIRTHGKDFERSYIKARDRAGVRFIKSRISSIREVGDSGDLLIWYTDEQGRRVEETFDLAVLSIGLCPNPGAVQLAQKLGIELDHYGYPVSSSFEPVRTSRPGIFVCGAYQGPKDIPSSVMDAGASAGAAGGILAPARGKLTRTKDVPEERDVKGTAPRIGVFVCRCGTNIGGVVDVDAVTEYAQHLPYVAHAEGNMFTCSQDTQDNMDRIIREKGLNRVVVAACSPRTHEPLFQETMVAAGLNKYLFEMANIRNHCSWVHGSEPDKATQKAKDLVRMAVIKAAQLEPLYEQNLGVNRAALVIGGGVAGLTASKTLSAQGYQVYLVERENVLGGGARTLFRTWKRENVAEHLDRLVREVEKDPGIEIFLNAEIKQVDGFVGNFKTTVDVGGEDRHIEHGVAILATGAVEYRPTEYLYGRDERVVTGLELDRLLKEEHPRLKDVKSAAFIQCVGCRNSERPYCSKVCCTHSIVNALELKKVRPEMDVYVVYRDLRTYALREDVYREAREKGVLFLRYDYEKGLDVTAGDQGLQLHFTDTLLNRKVEVPADLVILAAAVVAPEMGFLAQHFKVPVNDDGFFVEAHVKLRPVDFATDGVFVCGLAHAPKSLDESVAQAQAAAARAVTVLSRTGLRVGGVVSSINQQFCTGCKVCVTVCPFKAIQLNDKGKAEVNEALCKGCGLCVSSCRSGAPELKGFTDGEIFGQIEAFAL